MQDKGKPFKPGDMVDVTVKGARIHDISGSGQMMSLYADGHDFELPVEGAKAWCEAAAPDMYHGDVWRDSDGDLWLTQYGPDEYGLQAYSANGTETVGDLDREYGPLTLVHREDQS